MQLDVPYLKVISALVGFIPSDRREKVLANPIFNLDSRKVILIIINHLLNKVCFFIKVLKLIL